MSGSSTTSSPQVFMSYAWTNDEHSSRVLSLAQRLVADGVEVRIDKWDLKPGHDAHAFMESMVSDQAISKVLIISNKTYVEKANSRQGGAGIEAQILSPEIYATAQQDKFALILFELDETEKPYLPIFYGSRIYINLAREEGYEQEYEQLLRWIYDRPQHRRPQLGSPPKHLLDDNAPIGLTASAHKRCSDAIKDVKPQARTNLKEYKDVLEQELSQHRLTSNGKVDHDEDVITSIKSLSPVVSEIADIARQIARLESSGALLVELGGVFELLRMFSVRPPLINQWHEWDFDNYRFILHDAFLSVVAIFIKEDRLDFLKEILSQRYLTPSSIQSAEHTYDYRRFHDENRALEHHNQKNKLNRVSYQADMLEKVHTGSVVPFSEILQADLMIFLFSAAGQLRSGSSSAGWWPFTLNLCEDRWRPMEIFARAESMRTGSKITNFLGLGKSDAFKPFVNDLVQKGMQPRVGLFSLDLRVLVNYERFGIYP